MTNKQRSSAMRKLNHAFEYLRPRMEGNSLLGIPVNTEAEAGNLLATAMCLVARDH